MSRTKRIYNKIRRGMHWQGGWYLFYHPYHQFCCGHCKFCKDIMKARREKLNKRIEFKRLLNNESESKPIQ